MIGMGAHIASVRPIGLAYRNRALALRPIAHWPLDEASGTTFRDVSGNGRHAVAKASGEPLLGQSGPFAGTTAPLWDGTNDYANLHSAGLAAAFSGATGTLAGLIKIPSSGTWTDATGRRWIVLYVDINNRILLDKSGTNNTLSATMIAGGTNRGITITESSTDWIRVAYTWDKPGDIVKLYLDGVLVNAIGGLGTWAGSLSSANTSLGIGGSGALSGTAWSGLLAEVGVYSSVLTPAQIGDLAHGSGRRLILEGDSRTVGGQNAARGYPRQAFSISSPYRPACVAATGKTVAQMISTFAAQVAPYANGAITVVWGGVNDALAAGGGASAAAIYADLLTEWASIRAAGSRVVPCTEIDAQSASANTANWHSTVQPALNTLIKSDPSKYDVLVDLGANAALQNANDTGNYNADKIHLNATGYGVVAGLIATGVSAAAAL